MPAAPADSVWLMPAPLLAHRGRWLRADNARRNRWRVAHVVTAFAVGYPITLALGTVSPSPPCSASST
jgi:hypothetical protein